MAYHTVIEQVPTGVDKYFNLLIIVLTVLLIGGFLILKKVF